ncbi:MAG: hypothetical protein K9L30_13355 [Desulfobacterales bacterium]|nr:hypothetical protein [Desulfobacterales bacterium]
MKKLIIITLLTFVFSPLTQAFAGSVAEVLAPGVGAKIGFNASTNVDLLYGNESFVAPASPQAYVVMAKHIAGNKVIATTSMSNLVQSNTVEDCKGLDTLACIGLADLTATLLNADDNGNDNIDGLITAGWEEL